MLNHNKVNDLIQSVRTHDRLSVNRVHNTLTQFLCGGKIDDNLIFYSNLKVRSAAQLKLYTKNLHSSCNHKCTCRNTSPIQKCQFYCDIS